MSISHSLGWHKGRIVQCGEIEIELKSTGTKHRGLILPERLDPLLANAIQFGANIFTTAFRSKVAVYSHLSIVVVAVRAVPCDTTVWGMAYVTFQAICDAFRIDGNSVFSFDRQTGKFTLSLPCL